MTAAQPAAVAVATTHASTATRLRVGSLDGLRAVAVIAVVAYHLWPRRLPGGFLGVDVFMVLSGYLITTLLLDEQRRAGTIDIRRFWIRRLRRLAPAMLLVVGVVGVWAVIEAPRALAPTIRSQGLSALVYLVNWRLVADAVTYGGAVAAESPFVHLWSLAVEAQFYVVWAVVAILVLRRTHGSRPAIAAAAAAGAAVSALLMAALYSPDGDPLRIYYGTDTRAQAFLAGAVVAAVGTATLAHRWLRAALRLAPIALAAIVVAFVWYEPDVLYRGGFLAVAALTAVVVAASSTSTVGWLLDRAPLRLIGRVSYGIYLWHWPAITILTPARTGLDGPGLLVARLGVTAAGAAFSWVAVERPATRLGVRPLLVACGAAAAAVIVALLALPSTSVIPYADVDTTKIPPPAVVTAPATREETPPPGTVVIIGDSGMFDLSPALVAAFQAQGWTVVDASYPGIGVTKPGRSLHETWGATVRQNRADLVVVMLGGWDIEFLRTKGDEAYRRELDAAVGQLTSGDARVLWLSMLPGGRTPDRPVDRLFAELPERHGAVDYLDVESALRAPDGTWPVRVDGVLLRKPDEWHLCPAGAEAVTKLVLDHLDLRATGWEDGAWRTSQRYDDPPGGCDG